MTNDQALLNEAGSGKNYGFSFRRAVNVVCAARKVHGQVWKKLVLFALLLRAISDFSLISGHFPSLWAWIRLNLPIISVKFPCAK